MSTADHEETVPRLECERRTDAADVPDAIDSQDGVEDPRHTHHPAGEAQARANAENEPVA